MIFFNKRKVITYLFNFERPSISQKETPSVELRSTGALTKS